MIGYVAIGRNEGARLERCLASLAAAGGPVVYVDSGSSDGSVRAARAAGAEIVELPAEAPFTAARARNAGYRRLKARRGDLFAVMFIDGDCELAPGFPAAARAHLAQHPQVAIVCGRRRERFPEASLYNRLCDAEWAMPVGETYTCGGDALVRVAAFDEVGGFRDGLIAGEEPELCLRLRERGWTIWRLDLEMTRHDAAILKFAQWWRRNVRAGHAFAEIAALHRRSPKRMWGRETARALLWSAAAPAFLLLAALVHPGFLAGLLVYPAQILRLALRRRDAGLAAALAMAAISLSAKFAEAAGALKFWATRARGGRASLIEYKA
jgi:GT2 family glycosyltransferase